MRSKKTISPNFKLERTFSGYVAGVDEAGCAPLAGPVTAAAVILEFNKIPKGINDSKKLTMETRERLFDEIQERAVSFAVAHATVEEIDSVNIFHARMLAMHRAVEGLHHKPEHCLIDGNRLPKQLTITATPVVGGDARCLSIAAASILAKVTRDRLMRELAELHPGYGWEKNMGYPTPQHLRALTQMGITPHHRRTFSRVRELIEQQQLAFDYA